LPVLVLFVAALIAAPAEAGDLRFPLDCTLGRDCFIQQYVDRDPGPGASDFTCGTLAYEGHKGTDFRLADDSAMRRGVNVLAAAGGVVRGVRDGVPDVPSGEATPAGISGRECGNGVRIEGDDGWSVQYCHMRRGSIRVSAGARVAAGQVLGQVGLSGKTQFPHLHVTVRDPAGRVIDPFDARPQDAACSLADDETLWAEPIAYRPGGLLTAGFLERIPDYDEVRAGAAATSALPPDAPAMVFWAHFYGLRDGDRLEVALTAPDGSAVAETAHLMERDRAVEFRAVGRKARGPWAPGDYRGTAVLRRAGTVIDRLERTLPVR
jgi:murein DD-endopeptidase MepM/ murein hydrolase activator NlpD